MFRFDTVVSQHELSVRVRSHTSELHATVHCVFVLISLTVWQFIWDHFFNISVTDGSNFTWANTDEQYRAGCMHNDHQSLPPDCEIKNNCTRHVITDTLISLASETKYASDMKTLRILRNIKLKKWLCFSKSQPILSLWCEAINYTFLFQWIDRFCYRRILKSS